MVGLIPGVVEKGKGRKRCGSSICRSNSDIQECSENLFVNESSIELYH